MSTYCVSTEVLILFLLLSGGLPWGKLYEANFTPETGCHQLGPK